MPESVPPGAYIRAIEVVGLFGEFNYSLKPLDPLADPRILVLYGRNGSGKTTILKLIRSLLSDEDNAGHRTWLSSVPFERVTIFLTNNVVVEAVRKGDQGNAYKWSVKRAGAEIAAIHISARNGRVSADSWDSAQREKYDRVRTELSSLVPSVVYLDDRRTVIRGSRSPGEPSFVTRRNLRTGMIEQYPLISEGDEDDPVEGVLSAFAHSVRREALLLSNRGNQGAQYIYNSLVDRISSSVGSQTSISIDDVISKLNREQRRGEVLSAYGLVTSVDHSEMLRAIDRAGHAGEAMLAAVLEPYVESLSARFDALEVLHGSIDRWITNLGTFLEPKQVRFRVGDDVQVISRSEKPLPAGALSSGERHLLFLLTRAFLMRSTGGLLLVDEPELSLNVEWQRRLVRAMADNFSGSACQLIVASHSLEIAAQYEANLVEVAESHAEIAQA